ncbi:MAG: hypothetical protein GWN21_18285 [Gammaproteobacteria bacterium]|nr:hypothetical protein [Gammaproteobacteria bacterium]NIV49722.1 hypothetical protein [Gammaproteobacteria bacterium]NIW57120.1 hypothetical protein [Gammaproteobacteria bacterium]
MDSIELRSRRDPAFWIPLLLSILLLLGFMLAGEAYLSQWLEHLQELASSDPEAAESEVVRILRPATWLFCLAMFGFCAYLMRYFQLGLREGRIPPSGWWSFGALRAIAGPKARRMSRVGLVVSALLLIATLGLVFAVEHMIRVIEAGVPAN